MRLKTPIFLGLLVGSICLFIFLIWPAIGEVQKDQATLKKLQEYSSTIQKKNQNIDNLVKELSGVKAESKKFAETYLPYVRKEEKMTNAFFALVSSYPSMLIGSFSEENIQEAASTVVVETPQDSKDLIFGAGAEGDPAVAPASTLPTPRVSRGNLSVTGNYDDIKALINRIYALDIMNNVTSLNVGSVKSDSGAATNLINAQVSVDFSYIPMAKINKDYNNPIFSKENFDFKPADDIKTLLTEKASEVTFEAVERSNPFLPQS